MRDQPLRSLAHAIISNKRTLANRRGMTIVEVPIVLTIVALILGIVAYVGSHASPKASIHKTEVQHGELDQRHQRPDEQEDDIKSPRTATHKPHAAP